VAARRGLCHSSTASEGHQHPQQRASAQQSAAASGALSGNCGARASASSAGDDGGTGSTKAPLLWATAPRVNHELAAASSSGEDGNGKLA